MKQVKLDFLEFSGGDPSYWINQSERYFWRHGIIAEDQVAFATFHLEGHAQIWYQCLFEDEESYLGKSLESVH